MVPVPKWVETRWRREYALSGTAGVSSPDNMQSVALYLIQAILGVAHLRGATSVGSFEDTFGHLMLTPWALLYVGCGLLGVWTVLMRRGTRGARMLWAQPEVFACVGLLVANGMYVAGLLAQLWPGGPLTTLLMGMTLGGAAGARILQVMAEQVKTSYFSAMSKNGARNGRRV